MKKKPLVQQQYFNMHVHDHPYNRHPESYKPLIDFIRECQHKRARLVAILDVDVEVELAFLYREVLEINLREKIKSIIIITVFEGKRFSNNYDNENKVL